MTLRFTRRAQGDRSPENAITLAEAYSHPGLGPREAGEQP